MSDHVRVLRVLEYSGPREWVEATMERNAVKGIMGAPVLQRGCQIREAVIGAGFPEVVEPVRLADWPCSGNEETRRHHFEGDGTCEYCCGHMNSIVDPERVARTGQRVQLAADLRQRVQSMTGNSTEGHAVARTLLDLADELEHDQ